MKYAALLYAFISCACLAADADIVLRSPLLREVEVSGDPATILEVSGLTMHKGILLTVSDKHEAVYSLHADKGSAARYLAVPFLTAPSADRSALAAVKSQPVFDLEGISSCGKDLYLVDEKDFLILRWSSEPNHLEELPVDLRSAAAKANFSPFSGVYNAGYEGIACDAAASRLYVLNEREFRMIFEIDLRHMPLPKMLAAFDVPAGWNQPRFEAGLPVYPGFGDAAVDGGFLYALDRNDDRVLKIDVASRRIVARASYKQAVAGIYDSALPFGLGEGLLMLPQRILVGLDNNAVPRKSNGHRYAVILEFARPKGF